MYHTQNHSVLHILRKQQVFHCVFWTFGFGSLTARPANSLNPWLNTTAVLLLTQISSPLFPFSCHSKIWWNGWGLCLPATSSLSEEGLLALTGSDGCMRVKELVRVGKRERKNTSFHRLRKWMKCIKVLYTQHSATKWLKKREGENICLPFLQSNNSGPSALSFNKQSRTWTVKPHPVWVQTHPPDPSLTLVLLANVLPKNCMYFAVMCNYLRAGNKITVFPHTMKEISPFNTHPPLTNTSTQKD